MKFHDARFAAILECKLSFAFSLKKLLQNLKTEFKERGFFLEDKVIVIVTKFRRSCIIPPR